MFKESMLVQDTQEWLFNNLKLFCFINNCICMSVTVF